ncbi:uncharacterized protein LOC129786910 [Lutzomyia longipalpis]|uniref:uncharacterized protein LOC129786910 n=1 Tax=Lutzomyia longipalpis TaxID=7200 RepID=UPI0024835A82|nr:uncharacterized protein LOC129786910 [Lutzomyia longipalpis]
MATLKSLHYQRGSFKGQLKRLEDTLTTKQDLCLDELLVYEKSLEGIISKFETIQQQIYNLPELSQDSYHTEHDHELEFQDRSLKLQIKLKIEIRQRTEHDEFHAASNESIVGNESKNESLVKLMEENLKMNRSMFDSFRNNSINQVKLPQLTMPTFTGNYADWSSFKDSFSCTIHQNKGLSNVQKFQYLKAQLSGEAASIVKHIAVTDDNYLLAWNLLEERFEKKQSIVSQYLRTFLEQSSVPDANPKLLRSLYNTTHGVIQALDAMDCTDRDIWLIHILLNKLDKETKTLWARETTSSQIPTLQQFMEFLQRRCDALEVIFTKDSDTFSAKKSKDSKPAKPDSKAAPKVSYTATNAKKCIICAQGAHKLQQCSKFTSSTPQQQLELVRANKLCTNCLRDSHSIDSCQSSNCRRCGSRHHTLLHEAFMGNSSSVQQQVQTPQTGGQAATSGTSSVPQTAQPNQQQGALTTALVSHPAIAQHTLLPTISLFITGRDGKTHSCKALLDSCSQPNFLTKRLAEKCRLPIHTQPNQTVVGVGNLSTKITHATRATISSNDFKFSTSCEFSVVDNIVGKQPSVTIATAWEVPPNVHLADPHFAVPSVIDMLLGVEVYTKVIRPGIIEGTPILFETLFGYVVAGNCPISQAKSSISCLCTLQESDSLNEQIERFWKIEEPQSTKPLLSNEEIDCEAHYSQHTRRDEHGRYVVSLPTNKNVHLLGDSYEIARKRFLCIERKLMKNPELRLHYVNFMTEYEQLGHMRLMPPDYTSPQPAVYLPHHPVVKLSSSSTPYRIVFNGSVKTTSGKSLNDALKVGPKIQDDLFDILLRYRQHNVVIKADIRKMFRQVKLIEEDQSLLRIFWRDAPYKPLQIYLLTTVTYGTACATYLSTRTIRQLVEDEGEHFPAAKQAQSDFYIDDFLSGAPTVEAAKELVQQMSDLMHKGGFHLTKWMSNDPAVLEGIPEEEREAQYVDFSDLDDSIKALGVRWKPYTDVYTFTVTPTGDVVTKRTILSEISRIFDPLGFLAPVVVTAKILMQSLWPLKTDWDADLSQEDEIYNKWNSYKQSLQEVTQISVPRKFTSHFNPSEYHLLLFCDASEKAIAACAYMMTKEGDQISCRLLCAKTRVSPLKKTTVPRLELCAAVLAVKLLQSILSALKLDFKSIRAFSDSEIVLHWLAKEPQKWKTFVANRVSEIQQQLPRNHWHHVPSELNPADVASRGTTPSELANNTLWWHGPDFALLDDSFNDGSLTNVADDELLEQRVTCVTSVVSDFWKIIDEFSSHTRMIRYLSYWRRYLHNLKARVKSTPPATGPLTVSELTATNLLIVSQVQRQVFAKEFLALKSGKKLTTPSRIIDLNPFLDENGIIRVGGRIQKSSLPISMKHQILLPDKHHFTRLLAEKTHLDTCHGGPKLVEYTMKQRYWPLRGYDVASSVTRKCVRCFRCKPKPMQQIMGNLPADRVVQPRRPFTKVGVDFCGPFYIRAPLRRATKFKIYVAIFICFVSRAVHLEMVTDLSSEAFIAALTRFTARRGKPSDIYCDNATNFVGAAGKLKEIRKFLLEKDNQEKIIKHASEEQIQFHFIPPRSPNFGGLWESAVKIFKRHFYRVAGNVTLTYESFLTIMVQIESCMNSRPLTPKSSDPSDLDALTPSHFFLFEPANALPTHDVSDVPTNRLNRWRVNDQIVQHFWRRWAREVLLNMQQRRKWQKEQPNLQPGDLVVMIEDNLPPLTWLLGRIVLIHPGEDKKHRVATVQTKNGQFKRAISKLALLPVTDPTEQEVQNPTVQPREYVTAPNAGTE